MDEELRVLERAAKVGGPEEQARYFAACIRAGRPAAFVYCLNDRKALLGLARAAIDRAITFPQDENDKLCICGHYESSHNQVSIASRGFDCEVFTIEDTLLGLKIKKNRCKCKKWVEAK